MLTFFNVVNIIVSLQTIHGTNKYEQQVSGINEGTRV